MKAWLLNSTAPIESRPLQLVDVETPTPRPDELLVQVRTCGICRTDLHVVEGELAPRRKRVIPGHQVVGEVVATGERTDPFEIGQRVGVAWLHRTCGECRFCRAGHDNLCERPEFTGWTAN